MHVLFWVLAYLLRMAGMNVGSTLLVLYYSGFIPNLAVLLYRIPLRFAIGSILCKLVCYSSECKPVVSSNTIPHRRH